ncbi:MAG: pro-sigmaK processing inhibitor BofA family protein [Candidatus Altiarchaeota archaeon]|nr:pro-sigmaK processing inhibitor BofA family protein [Candidatus Altiarchaeota archaeon]
MEIIVAAAIAAIALAVFVFIFSKLIKSILSRLLLFVLNGMGGLILLLILRYVFEVQLPINAYTAAIVLIFGIPGLACLLILLYGGVI